MATPFVTGVVSLFVALHKASGSTTSAAELRNHLSQTATHEGSAGHNNEFGWGLINPAELLADDSPTTPTPGSATPPPQLPTIQIASSVTFGRQVVPGVFVFTPTM